VIPASLPATSFKEFIAYARSHPGKLNYLNPSIGSASHLNTELIKQRAGVSITSVLYNGQPPGMVDLVSGQTHFGLLAPQVAGPQIRAGKLRAIAVAFTRRLPEFPEIPTLAEEGYPDAQVVAAYTVLVPKKTPRDVIAQWNANIVKALADDEVRRRIEAAGAVVAGPSTPADVDAFLQAETRRWDRFFKQTHIAIN
jgi:tripartite-type tricarboxylate transporter receptor subunit TctC